MKTSPSSTLVWIVVLMLSGAASVVGGQEAVNLQTTELAACASKAAPVTYQSRQLQALDDMDYAEGMEELREALESTMTRNFQLPGKPAEFLDLEDPDDVAKCCCGITYYETMTTHSGTCGACTYWVPGAGQLPGLYHITYERLCAICLGCHPWYWKSTHCGPCAG